MDTLILVCAIIISVLLIVIGFHIEEKIERVARLIFKDKVTYSAQTPVSTNKVRKHYKGKCPVCGCGVSSKRNSHNCSLCGQRLNWWVIKCKEKN